MWHVYERELAGCAPVWQPLRGLSSLERSGISDPTMGACSSSETNEEDAKKRSQVIDRSLEEDSKKLRRECKILLLGACLCGMK